MITISPPNSRWVQFGRELNDAKTFLDEASTVCAQYIGGTSLSSVGLDEPYLSPKGKIAYRHRSAPQAVPDYEVSQEKELEIVISAWRAKKDSPRVITRELATKLERATPREVRRRIRGGKYKQRPLLSETLQMVTGRAIADTTVVFDEVEELPESGADHVYYLKPAVTQTNDTLLEDLHLFDEIAQERMQRFTTGVLYVVGSVAPFLRVKGSVPEIRRSEMLNKLGARLLPVEMNLGAFCFTADNKALTP